MKRFAHFSGRFLRTSVLKLSNMPLQYSQFTVVFLGTNSAHTVPWRSKTQSSSPWCWIVIDALFSQEGMWAISIENSEPWYQDQSLRPKIHLPWWHFLKSWNLKRYDRETPIKLTKAVGLFNLQYTRNKFRTHSPQAQICC